jgi:beta-phosphoglucomutase
MVEAVLWDLDGVLVDTADFHFEAWQALLGPLGQELSEEEFRRTFGLRNDAILSDLLGDLPREEIARLSERKEALFRERARGRIGALPGALDLLQRLRQRGKKTALVSSTPRENLKLVLGELGVEDSFQTTIAADDVERGKPDPEGFLLAARRLEVEPRDFVVLEDATGGVEAAKRAGMRCIAVTTTRRREALRQADLVVSSLSDPEITSFLDL